MIAEGRFAASKAKAAAALGMSVTTFEKWLGRGMPRIDAGGYDLDDCAAFIEAWKSGSSMGGDEDPSSQTDLRERRLRAECDKLEQQARREKMKADEDAKMLLRSDDVHQWIAQMLLRIRHRLESQPDELQSIAPAEIRAQFRQDFGNAIHDLLLEMSGWEFEPEE